MKKIFLILFLTLVFPLEAMPHCQIPCGIYDDQMRIKMIEEDIVTVEKSMKQIKALEKESPVNYNQIVRWVNNKDKHADKIADTVTYYFMAQRVKPAEISDEAAYTTYLKKLVLLHEILFYSMKAKQSLDNANVSKMRESLSSFKEIYFAKE